RITALRLVLAVAVMIGVGLTVRGGSNAGSVAGTSLAAGVTGGSLAAVSYAGTTLLARYAVPRYGAMRVLLLEILGGLVILGVVLPLSGHAPQPPATTGGWVFIAVLALGTVIAANVLFFNAAKRIDAAPTAVAATIEPVAATLLALAIFHQQLTLFGWIGLL